MLIYPLRKKEGVEVKKISFVLGRSWGTSPSDYLCWVDGDWWVTGVSHDQLHSCSKSTLWPLPPVPRWEMVGYGGSTSQYSRNHLWWVGVSRDPPLWDGGCRWVAEEPHHHLWSRGFFLSPPLSSSFVGDMLIWQRCTHDSVLFICPSVGPRTPCFFQIFKKIFL
jgi:hypothetical protein